MKKHFLLVFLLSLSHAFASGGAEDQIADFMSWVVLIVLPIGFIYIFWQGHIYPEKVAERKNHPQLEAIKTMCLLSLFVGGLLWPIAMIWANYNYPSKENESKDNEDDVPSPTPVQIPESNQEIDEQENKTPNQPKSE